jgi:hypothetical protein
MSPYQILGFLAIDNRESSIYYGFYNTSTSLEEIISLNMNINYKLDSMRIRNGKCTQVLLKMCIKSNMFLPLRMAFFPLNTGEPPKAN